MNSRADITHSQARVLVTGANGQLGRELRVLAADYPQLAFSFLNREDLPIENESAVAACFEKIHPHYCINCAAYTAVDQAESDREAAFRINADAVGYLAKASAAHGTKFIHVSTDYVFNGLSSEPIRESAATDPVNVYGASKKRGEELAQEYCRETVILRTAWVYSSFGKNFVKTMIRLMKERESVNVVMDQVGAPTYAADLAEAILAIASAERFIPGIYHYCNEGRISWYEFALEIRNLTGSSCQVNPIRSDQYPMAAKRPMFSLLDCSRIQADYAIAIPFWRNSLVKCLDKLAGQE